MNCVTVYPAETVYELIITLQLYSQGKYYKFLDDKEFVTLKNTLDARMKELSATGKRVKRKQAGTISHEEEDSLCRKGILGTDTPPPPPPEHRNLRAVDSQLSVHTDTAGRRLLRYGEDASKDRQGGLKHRKIVPKVVDAHNNDENKERCILHIYETYMSRRPTSSNCSHALYLRPLADPKTYVWFSCQALGIHKITTTVSRLCAAAGLSGFRTNHSLRTTAASRLYDKKFNEQLVSETTGYRSTSVRSRKRTSETQRKAVSRSGIYSQKGLRNQVRGGGTECYKLSPISMLFQGPSWSI